MFDAIAATSGWVSYAKCLRGNVHSVGLEGMEEYANSLRREECFCWTWASV